MNPRKVGAPDTEPEIADDFGSEERVLEEIVIPQDQLIRPSEMFAPESETRPAQRKAVLDYEEPVIPSPARATPRPPVGRLSANPPRSRGPARRFVGAVTMVAASIAVAVLAGAAVRNRLDTSVLSQYLDVGRTRISALLDLLPGREVPQRPEVVRDAAVGTSTTSTNTAPGVTASTTGATDSAPATVDETRSAASEPRSKVNVATPRSRASLPSARPTVPSSARRAAPSRPTPPSARPVTQRTPESRPASPVVSAPPSSPALTVVTSASPVPAASSASPVPPVNPVPLAPLGSAAVPSPPSPAPPPTAVFAPSATAPSAPPAGTLTAETRAVALALNRYQDAFSALDVNAAHAVWPSVDVKALAKAFDQLEEQTFDLEGCNITVAGAQAEADCAGHARYIPKVGNRTLRVEPRRWRFKLRQANDQWFIDAVDAR